MSAVQSVTDASNTGTATPTAAQQAADQKNAFLTLLVAQIKNQNPLEPADGIQFVTQLAQFSQLEQVISMRGDVEAIRGSLAAATDAVGQGD